MLSPEAKKKLSNPGLRFEGFRSLPLASKIAISVLGLIVLAAIFAPLIAPYSPNASGLVPADMTVQREIEIQGVGVQLVPDNSIAPNSMFWFGTDDAGRDLFSRAVYGARVSLIVGLFATGLALLVAAVLGSIAATAGRTVSEIIMRTLDIIMSFPGIALAAVLVTALSSRLPILPVVIRISRPGKNVTHQWPDSSSILPSDSMLPQVGVFTEVMPAPMNDSDASKTIASATSTVANTRMGAMQLRAT